jgi:hypothetical protein
MFTVYVLFKFHMPSSIASLVIAMQPKNFINTDYVFVSCRSFAFHKNCLNKRFAFFVDLFISGEFNDVSSRSDHRA